MRTKSTTAAPPSSPPRRRPTERYFCPLTESMMPESATLICGSKTARIATTSTAVMTVTITHPGTSPRSSRAAVSQAVSHAKKFIGCPSTSAGQRGQRDEAGVEREQDGYRQDEEDDRDHHRDLLAAPGFQQGALAGFPDVDRLGAQHVGERCAAFDRDDESLEEAGERRERRLF